MSTHKHTYAYAQISFIINYTYLIWITFPLEIKAINITIDRLMN